MLVAGRCLAQLVRSNQVSSSTSSFLKSCLPAVCTSTAALPVAASTVLPPPVPDYPWSQHFSRTITFSSALLSTVEGAQSSPPAHAGPPPPLEGHRSKTLDEALDRLVTVAVEMVEQGKIDEAVGVLKQGIDVLAISHPGSAEVGELHNQVALLRFFQARADDAATHAATSLDMTRAAFGTRNMLTGHRMVRLGTIRFGQGQLGEAAPLLQEGVGILEQESGEHDPGRAEGNFYLALTRLAGARDSVAIADVQPDLLDALQRMKRVLGAESMIITLALTQHGRVVLAVGGGSEDFRVSEAMYRQHLALQEARDTGSEDTAISAYKLAVLYYSHHMLQDARALLQKAAQLLRALFPEEHDLVVLCKHRVGMIAAAGGDHRAATQLLTQVGQHYRQQDEQHVLAAEADVGLAAAKIRAMDVREDKEGVQRRAVLEQMMGSIKSMEAGLGEEHMLVQAALTMHRQVSLLVNGS